LIICIDIRSFVLGFMGETSWHSLADSRQLHLHERSTFRGDAQTPYWRMDSHNTISSTKGFWYLRVSNIHDSTHRSSCSSHYSWWVVITA